MIPQLQKVAWVDVPKPHATLTLRRDVPVPKPAEGEVLIKMECSGFWYVATISNKQYQLDLGRLFSEFFLYLLIVFYLTSHSDLHNIYGDLPMTTHIAGHEGVGRVVAREFSLFYYLSFLL